MFCSHCGAQASGNFCAGCGTALGASTGPSVQSTLPSVPSDWSETVDYDVLLRVPEVRDLIASYAARSKSKLTGEQFLELCDKFISPLAGGLPLSPLAKVGQSMYAKMGVKTGKSRAEFLPDPAGRVLVRVLCSLAEHGQELRTATPATEGCVLEASLPSDLLSFAGELVITVERVPRGTKLEAFTNIPGQMFDWGKSTRCLAALFNDLHALPRAA